MIFFDIDDTLVDHEKAQFVAAAAFQKRHAERFPEPTGQFLARWHALAEKHFQRYVQGLTSEQGKRWDRLRELFGEPDMPDGQADEIFSYFMRGYEDSWEAFPDVVNCLERLKGRPLGIISNGGASQQRDKLGRTRIASYFSLVIISGEVGVAKPDPGIFRIAAEKAGADPKTCVYVGDRRETDAVAATRAGFRGIWLDRKGKAKNESEVAVMRSLAELPKLLYEEQG
jgi:putative hydrolase of the HAD superfamily